jgi:hypothetical protein
MSQPLPMYDPRIMQVYQRRIKQKKEPTYIPIADGFITTSGNAERGAKWGNITSVYPIATSMATSTATSTANLIGTSMAMMNKKAE